MKVGIVSSGVETLSLFSFLSCYDHEYIIYYDSLYAPYGWKSFDASLCAVQKGISFLKDQGCEKIIIPPVYELYLSDDSCILPLFKTYLLDEVFPHSLVGKLGIFGEYADLEKAQELIILLAHNYSLTDSQKNTKTFSYPFHFRFKQVDFLNSLLTKLSWKSFLVNTVLKNELRYFKDAHVDSVIPMNYMYFYVEKTIVKFFNFKKIRFHGMDKLEKLFSNLVQKSSGKYSISFYSTDQKNTFLSEKRIVWKLTRGNTVNIDRMN